MLVTLINDDLVDLLQEKLVRFSTAKLLLATTSSQTSLVVPTAKHSTKASQNMLHQVLSVSGRSP